MWPLTKLKLFVLSDKFHANKSICLFILMKVWLYLISHNSNNLIFSCYVNQILKIIHSSICGNPMSKGLTKSWKEVLLWFYKLKNLGKFILEELSLVIAKVSYFS